MIGFPEMIQSVTYMTSVIAVLTVILVTVIFCILKRQMIISILGGILCALLIIVIIPKWYSNNYVLEVQSSVEIKDAEIYERLKDTEGLVKLKGVRYFIPSDKISMLVGEQKLVVIEYRYKPKFKTNKVSRFIFRDYVYNYVTYIYY